MDRRQKNANWQLQVNSDGTVPHQDAELAVLMDIRDELQVLNRRLNFLNVYDVNRLVSRALKQPARRKSIGKRMQAVWRRMIRRIRARIDS